MPGSTATSIIDNSQGNTLLFRLGEIGEGGKEICLATAFFSLDALMLLADTLAGYERVRILFGDDADAKQRVKLLEMLRRQSDEDLLAQRENLPALSPLKKIEALFAAGKVEARCYTSKKFHAKAYLVARPIYPKQSGILGSGNFTRAGLTQNVELNVLLTTEQTTQLSDWFEARWNEAAADVVTEDVLKEIRRQIDLYEPYILYLKALLTWGQQQQDSAPLDGNGLIWERLDPHQELGFRQAVRILQREGGVLLCDGVGLGKSFVALALIEKYCREGKNVLLIAPKSILLSSWKGYVKEYLARYMQPFGSVFEMAMTDLGFDPDEESVSERVKEKTEELSRLAERADVIIVDESHNFRATASARYKNLYSLAAPTLRGTRKQVILLTATPINTAYRDLSAQLSLITHDEGSIAGYSVVQIRRFAAELDREARHNGKVVPGAQLSLEIMDANDTALRDVLENVVIQRSRKTCRELARAAGKTLHFPKRRHPACIEYTLDGAERTEWRELIGIADRRFRPGVNLFRKLKAAQEEAEKKGKPYDPEKILRGAGRGIKLAAFLPGQYRRQIEGTRKQDLDEVHLAGLVYANTLKQLESSPVAFQGILQSLGMGLIARLRYVLGAEASAPLIAPHEGWVQAALFGGSDDETEGDLAEEGDTLDETGEDTDEWLTRAVQARKLDRKLAGFNDDLYEVERWKNDIVADLEYLKEIHAATRAARQTPDPKLKRVTEYLKAEVAKGSRVLVFTQSQRTADYLEAELKARLGAGVGVARIDSRVEDRRATILHAFSPGYNARPLHPAPSVPHRIDVLISTDVLSEGVNLQETGAILNYDIHWNPVRLIQRIGRVDRRLNPAITPESHEFAIYNVLPPHEIESIIGLVGAVENRTLKISRTLGLDESFFKETDPAGTLQEFNAQYDGTVTETDAALTRYVALTTTAPPDERTRRLLDAVPPGAFGVWKGAPCDGLFALFTMEAKRTATDNDRERFAAVLGRPILALYREGKKTFDAGEILALLKGTTPGEPSALPTDEEALSARLKKLRNDVRQGFRDISLPATIAPKLVCWLELRQDA